MADPTYDPCVADAPDLQRFEGVVPWLYLDTRGYVTVGAGTMLPDLTSALAMPFIHPDTCQRATIAEVVADFERVKGMSPGKLPMYYRHPRGLELQAAEIATLLTSKEHGFVDDLRAMFPGYDAFPHPAQVALLDMAYNMGSAKLRDGYPNFCAAVKRKDWAAAALGCHRRGPSDARNIWTANQFQEAAKV